MPDALLRALELTIARRVDGLLAGDHRSALLGRGTELAQVRPYVPGDDVRLIDWDVTARTGEPHVRVHLAERVLVTWIVLDTSPSMAFGTADRRKADVALGVALAIGHAASVRGNRVGLVGVRRRATSAPAAHAGARRPGRRAARRCERTTARTGPAARASRSRTALRRLAARPGSASLVVIVSDFRGPRDWRKPLLELAGRHEVLAVEIRDPREQELEPVGTLWLVDPETGSSSGSTRATGRSARASPRPRPPSAPRSRASSPGPASLTSMLSTERDWLRDLGDLRAAEAPMSFVGRSRSSVLAVASRSLVGAVRPRRRRRRRAGRAVREPGARPEPRPARRPAGGVTCRPLSRSSRSPCSSSESPGRTSSAT